MDEQHPQPIEPAVKPNDGSIPVVVVVLGAVAIAMGIVVFAIVMATAKPRDNLGAPPRPSHSSFVR